jgi:hypothetical protein
MAGTVLLIVYIEICVNTECVITKFYCICMHFFVYRLRMLTKMLKKRKTSYRLIYYIALTLCTDT